MTLVCPGSCNAAYRRAWRDYDQSRAAWEARYEEWQRAIEAGDEFDEPGDEPEPPDLNPVPGDPVWCSRCAAHIRLSLAELDDLAAIHAAQADGYGDTVIEPLVSGSATDPSPSPAADDLEDLWATLHRWETAYRGTDPQARRGYLADAITTTVAWLTHHADGILAHPEIAADVGREILDLHRALAAKIKAGTGRRRVKQPCPRCDLYLVWAAEGDDYAQCAGCGRIAHLTELGEHASKHASPAAGYGD